MVSFNGWKKARVSQKFHLKDVVGGVFLLGLSSVFQLADVVSKFIERFQIFFEVCIFVRCLVSSSGVGQ